MHFLSDMIVKLISLGFGLSVWQTKTFGDISSMKKHISHNFLTFYEQNS